MAEIQPVSGHLYLITPNTNTDVSANTKEINICSAECLQRKASVWLHLHLPSRCDLKIPAAGTCDFLQQEFQICLQVAAVNLKGDYGVALFPYNSPAYPAFSCGSKCSILWAITCNMLRAPEPCPAGQIALFSYILLPVQLHAITARKTAFQDSNK